MNAARPVKELGLRAPWLHEGGISSLGFARDGRVLTVGTRSVRTWMAATGELAAETERGPREGELQHAVLSPLRDRWVAIAYGGSSVELRVWNTATGAYLGEVALPDDAPYVLCVSHDATRALVGGDRDSRHFKILSLEDGQVVGSVDTGALIEGVLHATPALAFLADGSVVGSDCDGAVRAWDGVNPAGQIIVSPIFRDGDEASERNEISEIHAAPTGTRFAAIYYDGTRIYEKDGTKRQEIVDFYAPVAFSADGKHIAICDHSHVVVFDGEGAEVQSWSLEAFPATRIAVRADARWIALGTDDGSFLVREVGAQAPTPSPGLRRRDVLPGAVVSLGMTPDGGAFLIGCADGSLLSWRIGADVPSRMAGHGGEAGIRACKDGSVLTCGAGLLRRYASDGTLEMECRSGDGIPAWSPDGRRVAFFGRERVLVMDTKTGEAREVPIAEEDAHNTPIGRVVAVSDSGRLAIFVTARILVFEPDGRLLRSRQIDPVPPLTSWAFLSVAFLSEDVVAWGDTVRGGGVLHVSSGEIHRAGAAGEGHLVIAALDVPRNRVAFRSRNGVVLWDAAEHVSLAELDTSDRSVVAVHPDGRHLATAAADRRVVLWEIG